MIASIDSTISPATAVLNSIDWLDSCSWLACTIIADCPDISSTVTLTSRSVSLAPFSASLAISVATIALNVASSALRLAISALTSDFFRSASCAACCTSPICCSTICIACCACCIIAWTSGGMSCSLFSDCCISGGSIICRRSAISSLYGRSMLLNIRSPITGNMSGLDCSSIWYVSAASCLLVANDAPVVMVKS